MSQKYAQCSWSCEKCGESGKQVLVWPYHGETLKQTAERHALWTRQGCVAGCSYHATAKVGREELEA